MKNISPTRKSTKNKKSFTPEELLKLSKNLAIIESSLVEEYSMMIKLKTLQYMSKEISASYNMDMDEIKNVLESIITDEESHQRILNELTETLTQNKDKASKTSILKFPTTINSK